MASKQEPMAPEVVEQLRENTFASLALFASRKMQLDYQNDVPYADIMSELFARWDDTYGHDSSGFKALFNAREQELLDDFDALIIEVCASEEASNLNEFIDSPNWQKLSRAARAILAELQLELPEP